LKAEREPEQFYQTLKQAKSSSGVCQGSARVRRRSFFTPFYLGRYMPNTKISVGKFAGLGIDLSSDILTVDGSHFGSMMVSAGSPPSIRSSDSHDLRPSDTNEAAMHPSRSKDSVGDFLDIHTGIPFTQEHLDPLADRSLNMRDLSGELTLSRNDTLLTASASIGRSSAELNTILGNADSRLKSGAGLVSILREDMGAVNITMLEQAKNRTRVDLDIALESNVCVQDGYLKGHIKVRIWKHSKNDYPVLVSGGKVRVIGFECIMNEKARLAFYQTSAPLSEVASGLGNLYVFAPDGEGFCRAIDGTYSFPFALHLPLSSEHGTPKGVMHSQSGVSIRYIVMVFVILHLRDFARTERSIPALLESKMQFLTRSLLPTSTETAVSGHAWILLSSLLLYLARFKLLSLEACL
jgi:hypothetical protein